MFYYYYYYFESTRLKDSDLYKQSGNRRRQKSWKKMSAEVEEAFTDAHSIQIEDLEHKWEFKEKRF